MLVQGILVFHAQNPAINLTGIYPIQETNRQWNSQCEGQSLREDDTLAESSPRKLQNKGQAQEHKETLYGGKSPAREKKQVCEFLRFSRRGFRQQGKIGRINHLSKMMNQKVLDNKEKEEDGINQYFKPPPRVLCKDPCPEPGTK